MGKRFDQQCSNCKFLKEAHEVHSDWIGDKRCIHMQSLTGDSGCFIYTWHVLGIHKCPECGGEISFRKYLTCGCKGRSGCGWVYGRL